MTEKTQRRRGNITEHVKYSEVVRSKTANKYRIKNHPNDKQLENITRICNRIFEPVRNHFGKPIQINSLFRSASLNKKIGGVPNSQHLCINESSAMDISVKPGRKLKNNDIGRWIMANRAFDQLIFYPDFYGHSEFIHVSLKKSNNRHQVFVHKRNKSGRGIYLPYDPKELDKFKM